MSRVKKHLKISVRTLVEHMLRSGDLVMEFFTANRMINGTRAHLKLQASRPEEYKKEVPVSLQVERRDFILDIGGRIDGVFKYPQRLIIEEIKSTTRDLDKIRQDVFYKDSQVSRPQSGNQRHWGQLKVYCYIYALLENITEIEARLTYFQVESGEILELDHSFTFTELEEFFYDLVDRFVEWAEALDKWQRLRNDTAEKLKFPFSSYRPGQHRMAVSIYHTVEKNGQLIIQAPTGIGKTMAALFPAIKALGRGFLTKFFYLTARTTGKAVAEKALQEMRDKGLKIKSLTLTAKEKICFNPDSACNGEECDFARGYFDRVDGAVKETFQQDAFTRLVVEEMARKHQVCPFEFSLELAFVADCIICDYNYVFDPAVYLKRFFEEDSDEKFVFLIDEAHNLVDRAREMFSAELFKQPFIDLRRTLKNKLPEIYKSMGRINNWLRKSWNRCQEEGRPIVEKEEPADLYPLLRKFLKVTENWLVRNQKTPFREKLLDLYFEVSRFLRTAEQYDETYATCYEQMSRDLKLKLFCIDPSAQLEEALGRCKSGIFFSATMTPASYFRKILGCQAAAKKLILPSPFPQENLCLLVCDCISTLYRQRERTKEAVSQSIASLVKQKKGNYLLFFPSYRYMMMVYECYAVENGKKPDLEIILQSPGMTEGERDEFLQQFDENRDNKTTLVGFAVMGGVFGEGIDLVGDRLTGAVIVGVGLPAISLERELIREYFINPERGGRGFEYAYLYLGINRVLQAAGRVIRTEEDRGVILLVDERFAWQQYKSLFPREWNPIRVPDEQQLTQVLNQFWAN